jgi:hypothetical protein
MLNRGRSLVCGLLLTVGVSNAFAEPYQGPACDPGGFGNIDSAAEKACSENSFKFYESQKCITLGKQPPICFNIEFNNNTLRFHELRGEELQKLQHDRHENLIRDITAEATSKGYKLISISDFILDGDHLLKSDDKVALFGRLVKISNDSGYLIEPYIYAEDVFTSAASWSSRVPVLLGGASRELRKLVLSMPISETEQDVLTERPTNLLIVGTAFECTVMRHQGTETSAVCFNVNDGWKVAGFGD